MKHPVSFALLAGLLFFLPAKSHAAAPPNDSFANRIVLTGQAVSSAQVSIDQATREPFERSDTGYRTLWWTWTAPADGNVTVTTEGNTIHGYGEVLSVFNGTDVGNLHYVAYKGVFLGTGTLSVTFPAKAGTVYQLSVGGYRGEETGFAQVNIIDRASTITSPVVVGTAAAANDNLASAIALAAPTVTAFGFSIDATREGLERSGSGYRTLWWTWTAPADAQATMNTNGSDLGSGAVLEVYNGSDYGDLKTVAYNDSSSSNASVTFPVRAGSVYRVSVGTHGDAGGTSVLNVISAPSTFTAATVVQVPAAANDNFAAAQDLGESIDVASFGFNTDATTETLEPTVDGTNTLWWTWTAPDNGTLTVSTNGTTFDHKLTPYTGSSLTTLQGTPLTGSQSTPATSTFNVARGTVYHFVLGSTYRTGTAVLNLHFAPGTVHVSIVALTPVIHYQESQYVAFMLTRDGDLSKDLVVNLKLKGTGSYGSAISTDTKKMKAGKASVKYKGYVNSTYAPGATLKAIVRPGDGYAVGSPSKANIVIESD